MRILLISKSFLQGGSATGAANTESALLAAGHEVIRYGAYEQKATLTGRLSRFLERVIERLLFNSETHALRLHHPVFDLKKLIAEHAPDIVQLCDISGNVISLSDLAGNPCPVVHRMSDFWPYHGPSHYALSAEEGHPVAWWLFRKTLYNGTVLPTARVAPSQWLADTLSSATGQGTPLRIIRNATALPGVVPSSAPTPGKLRLGFIANRVMETRKGFSPMLAMLTGLAEQGLEVSLQVYGRISDNEKRHCPGVAITYHGPFARDRLVAVFESFDILLCPSQRDNSPNTLCESLAHGRPVIGQRGTGMDSYLEQGHGGLVDFWEDSGNSGQEFFTECSRILSDYQQVSRRAREYVATHLSPRIIGEQYTDLYQRLTGSPVTGPA